MKIFLDAGHNDSGWNTGAVANGLREQDLTYNTAKLCGDYLRQNGVEVKLSRPTKETNLGTNNATSLSERCRLANEWGADYFLSIHYNAGGGTGTETFYKTEEGRKFGQPIQDAVVQTLGLADRGNKYRGNLAVLNGTKMPAALLEVAFLDNVRDAAVISLRQHDIAHAIATGIMAHLDIDDKEDVDTPQADHWAQPDVMYLESIGVLLSEGRLDDPITRGEMVSLLARYHRAAWQ